MFELDPLFGRKNAFYTISPPRQLKVIRDHELSCFALRRGITKEPAVSTHRCKFIKYDLSKLSTPGGAYCIKRVFQGEKIFEAEQMLIHYSAVKKRLFPMIWHLASVKRDFIALIRNFVALKSDFI
ncbi:hypothetical protein DWU89_08105 [Parabacteroides acidifaciens]|uniref:Uncharacterized protein n=1 Tax=Parabacteroides acidifaciens TaxID=2290935 RepID=A0A3D8HFD0_9BACT|nr:hypothetical protein DWU89_08105 [Parabacteroides acidifaciens]